MTNILETTSFGASSTTDDVLSGVGLKGKRILVTGVSAGLGVETARSLAAHGAQVVGVARDLNKAKTATAQVRKDAAANGGSFELVELDLANLKSVRACADRLLAKREPLDVVIANAGVMATPFGHTADGFETQFGTNHLGHFVLVNRVVALIRTGGCLINVSSADEIGGRDCENCHVGKTVPEDASITAVSEGVRGYALDANNAHALWKRSEELVGESF